MQASKHPNASTPQIPREISRATWCDLLFRLGFHQVKLQRNIHYILSMMTGCGSLKRGTHTEKTMVLGTGMLGTWLHSCLCNVRQNFFFFLFHTQLQHKDNYFFQKTKKNFDYWAQLGLLIDSRLDSLSICYICRSIDHSELSCLRSILRLAAAQTSSVIFLCVFVSVSCPKAHLGFNFLFSTYF